MYILVSQSIPDPEEHRTRSDHINNQDGPPNTIALPIVVTTYNTLITQHIFATVNHRDITAADNKRGSITLHRVDFNVPLAGA